MILVEPRWEPNELSAEPLPPIAKLVFDKVQILMRYHQYSVVGLEHVPIEGRAILAVNHSFATYDGLFLGAAIYAERGRYLRGLAHDHLFNIPGLSEIVRGLALVPASPGAAKEILGEGRILGVAPGGLREALRPSRHRYKVWWAKRKGFVKVAIETQSPVIVAVCPSADDIFTVYPSPLTRWAYNWFRFPLPLFRGVGPTLIPRPVKLTHYLSAPLSPPSCDLGSGSASIKLVDQFHSEILQAVSSLLARARRAESKRESL